MPHQVRVGGTAAEATSWLSESEISCQLSAGAGMDLVVAMTVAWFQGTLGGAVSYDKPYVHPGGQSGFLSNSRKVGGSKVMILGENLGAASYSVAGRLGGTGCMRSDWTSDSSVVCKSPRGGGRGLATTVTLAVETGTGFTAVSYDRPLVLRWRPSNMAVPGASAAVRLTD